jgi:excisionase family DNA binding protein
VSGLLTKQAVAQYLGVSEKFVQRRRAALNGYVVGGRLRFRQSDIDAYLEENRLVRTSSPAPPGR